ncbi:hypothetical protein MTR67_001033 [Solanum verrucosum]|uniref:Uncharacterized protein n=1 Tax=Solanum verrucosum TaxID=315347 RepID=A0AAF0PMG7_SOLVR|nr:hypothetical protein MTR67_001033 [Solanum verrucosum]
MKSGSHTQYRLSQIPQLPSKASGSEQRMDKGDVEMLDAEKNVPASDVLVSNESPVKYENAVKTGKSNVEDKTHDHSDAKGEDLKNART